MRKTRKPLIIAMCALVAALGVNATYAWLTDSESVTNTFTVGNIGIDLEETKTDFKMVPGCEIAKDPIITVDAGSEPCWLFVEIEESGGAVALANGTTTNFDDFIDYSVTDEWTALEGHPGVYYRKVVTSSADQEFAVLSDNKVEVFDTVTKEMMDKLKAAYDAAEAAEKGSGKDSLPNLIFTAYAVQLYETNGVEFEPSEAWELAKA